MADAQIIGAATVCGLAYMGVAAPEIPQFYLLCGAVVIGSGQAATARSNNGDVRGLKAMLWAFLAGITFGYFAGEGVSEFFEWKDTALEVLAAYLISLFGGRAALWFSVEFDVAKFFNAIAQWISDRISRR